MSFSGLLVSEIFLSLQGETSLAGVPFAFIRLTGCNLRCTYCDSAYAFKGGRRMAIEEIVSKIRPMRVRHVLLTGGEPLMQRQSPALVRALREAGYIVSIETSGEAPIGEVSSLARIVLDAKTPSSGMCRGGFERNLPLLKPEDELKFVIASPSDYEWAKSVLARHPIRAGQILFSPAVPAKGSPGSFPGVEPRWLAERILEDGLAERHPVRMQIQLHKLLWGADRRGV